MRCAFLVFLTATITTVLSSVAAMAAPFTVVFINPGGSTEFWGDVSATMRAAAEDLDIELEVINTDRDRLKMLAAANALEQRPEKPDYVIIVNELQQAPAMLAALQATRIPVFILLNRMSTEQRRDFVASGGDISSIIGSIVPDNEIAGYEMAISIISAARRQGLAEDGLQILALLGDAATPAALAREAGLMRAMKETPDARLIRAFPVMWSRETAHERTLSVLLRFDIDAVWAANDQISLGAQQAALEAGEKPGQSLIFAGLNWSDEGLAAVRDGTMTMTHGGHFFAGAWSMVMLRDLEDGKISKGENVEFPMSAIGIENVDRFIERFGNRSWNDIDFRYFLRNRSAETDYVFTSEAILNATSSSDEVGQ